MSNTYYVVGVSEDASLFCPAGEGIAPGHQPSEVVWGHTYATGQRGGVKRCACGAEWRVLEYAKNARRRRR